MGGKRPSDFSSDLVTHGSAQFGIVAASAKCEALNLAACRDTSLNGVLGVECSNHSVPTILFNDLAHLSRVGLFHVRDFCVTSPDFMLASSSGSSAPARASQLLIPYLQLLSDAPVQRRSSDW